MIKILPKSKVLLTPVEFLSIVIFKYSSKPFFKTQNSNKKPYKSYNSYQNQSIKPQSSNTIELADLDDSKWRLQLTQSKQIKDFNKISYSLQFLRTPQLALFLKKLYPYLNLKSIQQNEQLFERIQNRLKSFSETMNIQMQQLMQILKFHSKFRSIKKDFDFYHNFGFEKYASMTASNFIYNRKFNINQAIFVFSSLVPLGDSHLNLFINFLKYFKTIASEQPQLLKLEHYLTILNTKFAKRNDIMLENTSYDHVLHQLLKNLQQVLKGVSITFKTETLCTLLKIDNRISYQTDPQKHIKQTISLIKQLAKMIGVDWFSKSWLIDDQTQGALSMINVVHILDCMLFVKNNMINYQNYSLQMNAFCEQAYTSMQNYIFGLFTNPTSTIIAQKSIQLLIRFSLNPLILPHWIADTTIFTAFQSILTKFHITNQETFLPLAKAIDQFSQQKYILQPLLKIAVQAAILNLQKNIILKDLIIICIQNKLQINTFSEYFLKLNKEEIENNLVFLIILEKLTGSKALFLSLKEINIRQAKQAIFINDLYKITLSSRTIQGFTIALQILKEHYYVINRLIQPLENSDNKKSERNHYLSRESLQFSYIIFINILNGVYIPQNLQRLFNRIIVNNILIYQILKKLFREDYPLPNLVERPRFFGDFTTVFRNMLNFFQSMDKYNYFVWDLMLKLYSTQALHIRQKAFPLIEQCFLRTIRKQKARKVVLTMTMMRFIASGVIVGPRPKLQQLFQLTIDDLLSAEENKAFYYKCYVQIIFSAIAADVLTPIYFDKIIADSLKRDENLKHTSVIMLIYGASLKGRNLVGGVVDPTIISKQQAYIQRLINQRIIKRTTQKSTNNFTIALNNEVICYLFSFGTISIIKIDKIIYEYIQNCNDFSKWRSMANCYTPENYNMYFKEQAKFRGKINKIFIEKLIYFKSLKMVSEKEESYFIDKFK